MCKDYYAVDVKDYLPQIQEFGNVRGRGCAILSEEPLDTRLRLGGIIIITYEEANQCHDPSHDDPKTSALRQRGCLHPYPQQVADELFAASRLLRPP